MGKDLKGKELGIGISQRKNGIYQARYVDMLGNIPISQITQLQIEGLIKKIDQGGYGYETQNKARIILLDMFNKALIDKVDDKFETAVGNELNQVKNIKFLLCISGDAV